jgi:hypothetical protein
LKVHITLSSEVTGDADAKERAKRHIVEVVQLRNVNERRFSRYGVLSGDVDPSRVELIRTLSEVATVEYDGMKRAI